MSFIENPSNDALKSVDTNPYLTRKSSMLHPFSDDKHYDEKDKHSDGENKRSRKNKKIIDRLKRLFGY
jgi:hypothetical protein